MFWEVEVVFMKQLVLIIGILLILLGLEITISYEFGVVALVYFLAGALLVVYSFMVDRVTRWVHVAIGILYAVPIIGMLLLAIYGNHHTTDFTEDVVFVLGAGLIDDEIPPSLEARLDQALLYFDRNPDATFIVCGGYGEGQTISEARAMADFLIVGGIPENQILLEDVSTNTYENFLFALELVNEQFPEGFDSVVITNHFHMYRSGYLAHHLGIEPARFGAPTPIHTWHRNFMREFLAVFNTWWFQT